MRKRPNFCIDACNFTCQEIMTANNESNNDVWMVDENTPTGCDEGLPYC